MRHIEWLRVKSKDFGLVAEYINENSLKVYSPKFLFDSWMITETEDSIELWHQSKKCNIRNISYHLQKTVSKKKKVWVLETIVSHNKYVAFGRYKTNIVDRLLSQEPARLRLSV